MLWYINLLLGVTATAYWGVRIHREGRKLYSQQSEAPVVYLVGTIVETCIILVFLGFTGGLIAGTVEVVEEEYEISQKEIGRYYSVDEDSHGTDYTFWVKDSSYDIGKYKELVRTDPVFEPTVAGQVPSLVDKKAITVNHWFSPWASTLKSGSVVFLPEDALPKLKDVKEGSK